MNTNYSVKDCILIDVPTFTDERGTISVMDKELPFGVKRIFWLHHIVEGKDRGAHALLDSTEIIVAVHGHGGSPRRAGFPPGRHGPGLDHHQRERHLPGRLFFPLPEL